MAAPALPQTGIAESFYPPAVPVASGPILVATDASSAGDAAFRAASAIAAKLSATVEVVIVVDPLPVLVPEPSVLTQPLVASPELLSASRDRVIERVRPLAPEGLNWHVDVEYGRPSSEIADKAQGQHSQLIVIGLVHHGVVDRVLDGDTALDVVRNAHSPVLLASSRWNGLPRRAVFAVDFSIQSMRAARAGLRLLGDDAKVSLAHVRPPVTVFDGMGMWEEEYDQMATRELGKFAEALNAPKGVHIEQVLLSGRPAPALLHLADEADADLIVAGTRGAGLVQRLLVGSVATRIMHHSTRSLLIVPDLEE